jgi:glycosyltransferase involved in cell wall biosynthesis
MRIGLNLLYLLPGIVGGTETYAAGLLAALARIDHKNEYVVFLNRESADWPLPPAPNLTRVVCPVLAAGRVRRYAFEQLRLPALLRANQIDLVHSLGYVAPLRPGCRSVVTVPDLNYQAFGHAMPVHKRSALGFFIRESVQRSDHVITLSEFMSRELACAFSLPPERVTVTHLAPRPRQVDSRPAERAAVALARFGIRPPFIIAFSSRTPNKNIPRLLQAFARARQQHGLPHMLVLAGHPPQAGDYTTALNPAVCLTGFLSDDMLQSLLPAAELLVCPSIYEGFGLPILEAMAAGVAVACSSSAALPEVAGDAALYFDPFSIEDMARQISRLALDQGLRAELCRLGRDNLARFSWDVAAQKTLSAYVLASRPPVALAP